METHWQVLFIDTLFLVLAIGIGRWFKSWLQEQHEVIDQRLRVLEVQQKTIELLSARLQSACMMLERLVERQDSEDPPSAKTGAARRPLGRRE